MYKVLDYDTLAVVYQAKTTNEIAEFVGTTREKVIKHAYQYRWHGKPGTKPLHGFYIAGNGEHDYSYRRLDIDKIAEMIDADMTDEEIATEFRVTPRTIRKHRRQIADRRMKDARLPEEIRRIYSGVGAGVKKSLFHELTEQERFCREWDTTVELLKKTYGDALNKIMLRAHNRSGVVL